MRITEKKYFDSYNRLIGNQIPERIKNFFFSVKDVDLSYLIKASAVYSSNIEGNSLDLNSYMKYERMKSKLKYSKEIAEIKNLIKAYEFAGKNELTEKNMLEAHRILSETLLIKGKRGKYREEPVGVLGRSCLVYLAVEPELVAEEMKKLFEDVQILLSGSLSETEVFYHASLSHLKFAQIHPFMDGNGRMARLFEKWFITSNLGKKFWKLPSEENYKIYQSVYYQTINLGANYYELDYDKCPGFLQLLPLSLLLNA